MNSEDPVLEFCGDVFRPINQTNNSPKDETINLTNNHCEGNYLEKTIVEKTIEITRAFIDSES